MSLIFHMKLYSVADEYIKYIRKSFPKVYSNMGKHETDRRNYNEQTCRKSYGDKKRDADGQ